jgi:hypothetical protein
MHLAAAGLLTTSDGKPKFVDFLDCTGGGDIDTSKKEASREEDGGVVLNGLSGRTLKLGEWARGTSEFRMGATRLLALLPSSVRRRIAAERKASFEVAQHAHVTRVQRELDALESGESKLTGFAKTAAKKDLELMLTELKARANRSNHPSRRASICVPVCLRVYPARLHPPARPVHPSICAPFHRCIRLSTCPPVHLSTCPPVHLSTCPPVHLSTCPPVHLSIEPRR